MTNEIKQRPDSPGVWWREGWTAPIYAIEGEGGLLYHEITTVPLCDFQWARNPPAGRWIQQDLTRPEFPQLPERPKLVYAAGAKGLSSWWIIEPRGCYATSTGGLASPVAGLAVIPHPDNDPEAVAAIERAKT